MPQQMYTNTGTWTQRTQTHKHTGHRQRRHKHMDTATGRLFALEVKITTNMWLQSTIST